MKEQIVTTKEALEILKNKTKVKKGETSYEVKDEADARIFHRVLEQIFEQNYLSYIPLVKIKE
jgi:hypothetical protein